eukprot:PhM_4_TR5784/c0_g1_i1/m.79634/K11341/YEATS4, GAS41, YAF9; YEATS domain-containing protein 4
MRVHARLSSQTDNDAVAISVDPSTATISHIRYHAVRALRPGSISSATDIDNYSVRWLGQVMGLDTLIASLSVQPSDIFVIEENTKSEKAVKREGVNSPMFIVVDEASEVSGSEAEGTNVRRPPGRPRTRGTGATKRSRSQQASGGDDAPQTSISVPLLIGSEAHWLGTTTNDEGARTHEWTVYVRCPFGGSLDGVIDKVVFQLHHTFVNPERTLTRAPYEITEFGWGQFVIGVQVFFKGCPIPYRYGHPLFLSPPPQHPAHIPPFEKPLTTAKARNDLRVVHYVKAPAIHEAVEEIVIDCPSADLVRGITSRASYGRAVPGEEAAVKEVRRLVDALKNENRRLRGEFDNKIVKLFELGAKYDPAYQ